MAPSPADAIPSRGNISSRSSDDCVREESPKLLPGERMGSGFILNVRQYDDKHLCLHGAFLGLRQVLFVYEFVPITIVFDRGSLRWISGRGNKHHLAAVRGSKITIEE